MFGSRENTKPLIHPPPTQKLRGGNLLGLLDKIHVLLQQLCIHVDVNIP